MFILLDPHLGSGSFIKFCNNFFLFILSFDIFGALWRNFHCFELNAIKFKNVDHISSETRAKVSRYVEL